MTFLSGIGFAFLFQPCCTPIVVAILTLVHNPALAALYLAVYGFAHATPAWLTPLLRRPFASERFIYASTFITGGVSLAIGTYFILVA
jgi:cytochrome c biogenesis protein CcdA